MINELIECDCMDYMKKCKDKQFDLAIVDPPYGIGMAREFSIDTKNGIRKRPPMITKEWDNSAPTKEYFDELFRVSKNQIIWGFDLVSCEKDHDYCVANEARYQQHIQQQELIPVQEIQQLTFGSDK